MLREKKVLSEIVKTAISCISEIAGRAKRTKCVTTSLSPRSPRKKIGAVTGFGPSVVIKEGYP
jgi:hypothetical protein